MYITNIPMQTRKKQRLKESRVLCEDHAAVLEEIDEDAAHQRQLSQMKMDLANAKEKRRKRDVKVARDAELAALKKQL
jgi:hypothetical protein